MQEINPQKLQKAALYANMFWVCSGSNWKTVKYEGQWEKQGGHFQYHLLHLETMLAVGLVFIYRSPTGEEELLERYLQKLWHMEETMV